MDEAPLVDAKEVSAQTAAGAFTKMADAILLNKQASFGGAVVIIPPEGGGEPVDLLLLTRQSPVAFWALLKATVEAALSDLDAAARQNRAYGR